MVAHTIPQAMSGSPFYRPAPLLNPFPYNRIVPGMAPDALGSPITAIPTGPGSTNPSIPAVVGDPIKRGSGTGFSFAELDGVNDALSVSTDPNSRAAATIMIVARLKSTAGFQTIFFNGPSGANRWDLTLFDAGPNRLRYVYSSSDTTLATHPWIPDTDWHVFTVTRTASTVNIGVDLQFSPTLGITTDPSLSTIRVGQRRGSGAQSQAIDIAEVIVFPTLAVSEFRVAEVKNLMAYYGLRWGDDVKP
ncbi:hypothetical protein GCM10010922_01470 [Microbacterium sorbitolivorans]|uniref:Uncharacterized protein n=1 Tax=Microbacterium sorbitolivorans TaxID=1867410 RepID=A0A367Y725_9MICO|nr:hypothetical protein [Microbacterium sorbitolivorans]RCK61666.1 hypothetical protein DTO57_03300 [Microbacterium sorbitolivorans]GGF30221.1 hypothetical protein GCM10010922_01470 [Microbacterium sorbitolivorans]